MKLKMWKILIEISIYFVYSFVIWIFVVCSEYVCIDEWEKVNMVYLILFVYYIEEEKSW